MIVKRFVVDNERAGHETWKTSHNFQKHDQTTWSGCNQLLCAEGTAEEEIGATIYVPGVQ